MKKTNYVANGVAMRWLNRSVVTINATFHLLDIYRCAVFKTPFFSQFFYSTSILLQNFRKKLNKLFPN